MVKLNIPYLYRHGRGYRMRRVVPPDVRVRIAKNFWLHKFPPEMELPEIARAVKRLAKLQDLEIASARGDRIDPAMIEEAETTARRVLAKGTRETARYVGFVHDLYSDLKYEKLPLDVQVEMNAIENQGFYRPPGAPLSEALEFDLTHHTYEADPRPFREAVAAFVELVGDLDVLKIERRHVVDFVTGLRARNLAPGTIRRRLTSLSAITNRALMDAGSERRNPFSQIRISGGAGGSSDRLPLHRLHYDRLDAYLERSRVRGETRGILTLMRYTGAGVAEIGGLMVEDVRLSDPTPHLIIRPGLRRLKAAARTRLLPLVPQAVSAAETALNEATSNSSSLVFGGYRQDGRGAVSLSAKLTATFRRAGIKGKRLTPYSLRHSFAEALKVSGADPLVRDRLMGWSNSAMAARYGSPDSSPTLLMQACKAAVGSLGNVPVSIYRSEELE